MVQGCHPSTIPHLGCRFWGLAFGGLGFRASPVSSAHADCIASIKLFLILRSEGPIADGVLVCADTQLPERHI